MHMYRLTDVEKKDPVGTDRKKMMVANYCIVVSHLLLLFPAENREINYLSHFIPWKE